MGQRFPPRRRRRFSGDGSPPLPRCTLHGRVGRDVRQPGFPLAGHDGEAHRTWHRDGSEGPAPLRRVRGAVTGSAFDPTSFPSPFRAASSSPESLRSLASPLLPLNARQSGIRLTASAPQASSSPFIGRELASLPIIPGGYGCKSPPPRSSSLPERRNGVGAIPAALPHARLASCDLEAARKQHGAQPVLSSSAMRDEPDLNNIIINSMPGTSSVRAV